MVLGGWGSVNLSHLLLLTKRERWSGALLQPWSNFDPNPLVGTSILLARWSEPTLAIWSERLAKGPYQKNTTPAVRLEPAILRLQIQAFTNWAIQLFGLPGQGRRCGLSLSNSLYLAQSDQRLFGLPVFLLPRFNAIAPFLLQSFPHLCTCPNHLGQLFLILSVTFDSTV